MEKLKRIGWRGGVAGTLVILAAAATAFAAPRLFHGQGATARANDLATAGADSPRARFAVLSRAHSNRCGMPASALDAMPAGARLQGSCCFPMDYRSYGNQVRDLKRYATVDVIPKDPYDIPVSLAKRLIAYKASS